MSTSTSGTAGTAGTAEQGLQRGAVGLREVLFPSITAVAPGAAIAVSIPGGAAFAGGSLPLPVVVALVACLFTALAFGELAHHLPSSGSVTTWTAQGLHPVVDTVLALSGFEAAAPLAEEARDPEKTIRRAVVGATLGIGLLYVFTTCAATLAFGSDRFDGFTGAGEGRWQGLARASYGLFWVLVFLAVVNSTIANADAGANVPTRTAFALGRIRLLPHAVTVLRPEHRSPYLASSRSSSSACWSRWAWASPTTPSPRSCWSRT